MTDKTNKSRLKKYKRPIGVFSGAILGLMIAAIPFLFWKNAPVAMVCVGVVSGLVVGGVIGFRFPSIAEGVIWLLSLIGLG